MLQRKMFVSHQPFSIVELTENEISFVHGGGDDSSVLGSIANGVYNAVSNILYYAFWTVAIGAVVYGIAKNVIPNLRPIGQGRGGDNLGLAAHQASLDRHGAFAKMVGQ